jgi:ABC-type transport system involved in cytochrome c biogenesis permease component
MSANDETAAPSPSSDEPSLLERWSDRVNPILIRELHQSLGGRVFLGTLSLACFAIVALALIFMWAARQSDSGGRDLLAGCAACLAALSLILVPMQAYSSTRAEVSGGTAEQLLMTRLRPRRIVLGKLGAGLLQFGMFLAVFAPLIGITYLLRGVDVPTILVLLAFAVLASVTAVAFATAMATVASSRPMQNLIQALTITTLVICGMFGIGGAYELVRELSQVVRMREFWPFFASVVMSFVAGIVLCGMIASASLAHGYENRSSGFRAFAFVLVALIVPWCLMVMQVGGIDEAPGYVSASFAGMLAPFWLWAACEDPPLSPRVRAFVPRNALLAWVAAPFLPGGQRGFVFTVLLALLGVAVGLGTPLLAGQLADRNARDVCLIAWSYAVFYAAIARLLRLRGRRGRARSVLNFVVTLAIAVIVPLLIVIVELLVDGDVRWHWGHLTNPFYTIDQMHRWRDLPIGLAIGAGVVALVVGVPNALVGFDEVRRASKERRARAAGV